MEREGKVVGKVIIQACFESLLEGFIDLLFFAIIICHEITGFGPRATCRELDVGAGIPDGESQ